MTISPAKPTDFVEVAALVNSAYRGESSRAGWTTEADYLDGQRTSAEALAEELQSPDNVILVMRGSRDSHEARGSHGSQGSHESQDAPGSQSAPNVQGESANNALPILSCVHLEKFEDEHGIGCYLGMLTVKPSLQAQGTGRLMMTAAEEFARREWGAKRMTLRVIQIRGPLIEWYERRGYHKTGETEPFPYGEQVFGIPLREDLHFIVFEKEL